MSTRPSSPVDDRDDPLGPSRVATKVGRPVSPWKRHWMAHQTKWLVAAAGVAATMLVLFAVWAVKESARFYAARRAHDSSASTPAASSPATAVAVGATSRTVNGPVRLQLEIGSLEDGERVIVTRDLAKILEDRLRTTGVEIDSSGPNTLTVYYDEERGRPLTLTQTTPAKDGAQDLGTSIRPTRIVVKLTLDRPQKPLRVLGQQAASPSSETARLREPATPEALKRLYRLLYQQSYHGTLDYLRQVDLPVPESPK